MTRQRRDEATPLDRTGPALVAQGLTKRFGDRVAVDGVDLTVERGRCLGVVGRNGAGKSTLTRMITTVSRPTSGVLTVLGLDPRTHAKQIKARLGVVPQSNNLDEDLTVGQNLEIFARYFGHGRAATREAADSGAAWVGLGDRMTSRVGELSGGMKRRLVIARALVNDPDLILLDEPTAALDAQSRQHIWTSLTRLRADGRSILLMSHDMQEVETLCDRVLIMESGRFVAEGAPHELIARHTRGALLDIVVDDAASFPWADLVGDADAQTSLTGKGVVVELVDADAGMARLRASDVPFTAATVRPTSLTDVYLRVTGREAD